MQGVGEVHSRLHPVESLSHALRLLDDNAWKSGGSAEALGDRFPGEIIGVAKDPLGFEHDRRREEYACIEHLAGDLGLLGVVGG